MLNPTCPQCTTPLTTRDAMLVMLQVAIWLQCEQSHDVVEIVPVSRFILTKEEQEDEKYYQLWVARHGVTPKTY